MVQILSYNASKLGYGTEVYGNLIDNYTDDGIELEGWEKGYRVWGNYINRGYSAISLRTAFEGPSYVWRNVINRFVEIYAPNQSKLAKTGNQDPGKTCGPQFWYHNTMLDAPNDYRAQAGLSYAHESYQPSLKMVLANNILYVRDGAKGATFQDTPSSYSIDYNLSNGDIFLSGSNYIQPNGITGSPIFLANHGSVAEDAGRYQLSTGSPGYNDGEELLNFNDGYQGSAPDIGAQEYGSDRMLFGLEAWNSLPGNSTPLVVNFPDPNEWYVLESRVNGEYLANKTETNDAVLWPADPTEYRQYRFVASGASGYYNIVSRIDGRYLANKTETDDAVFWSATDTDLRRWRIQASGASDYYNIVSKANGEYLANKTETDNAVLWPASDTDYRRWKLIEVGQANARTAGVKAKTLSGEIVPEVESKLAFYPNPATHQLQVVLPASKKSTRLLIQDLRGRTVLQMRLKTSQSIEIGSLPKGMYLVRLQQGTHQYTKKLLLE